jgi:hypothetical protein
MLKLSQVAAAVLVFKAFDVSFWLAAEMTESRAPIVIWVVGLIIWLVLSFFAWLAMRGLGAVIGTNND